MSIEVEVSLRIPNLKVRTLDENGYPIDHANVRFKRIVAVPAVPKPGERLQLATSSGMVLEASVVRADWHEENARFVVSCQYGKRSISPGEHEALVSDPDWRMAPLI